MTILKNKIIPLAAVSIGAIATAGCTTMDKSYQQAGEDSEKVADAISSNKKMRASTSVEAVDSLWLGGEAFRVSESSRLPESLNRNFVFRQNDPISISEMITLLSIETGIKIVLTQDAFEYVRDASDDDDEEDTGSSQGLGLGFLVQEKTVPGSDIQFTMNYKGSLTGLLDAITSKLGLFWRYERGEIVIKRNETKTYTVDLPSGQVSFSADTQSDIGGSDDTGSSGHKTKMSFEPQNGWENLGSAIESMLSKSGKHSISDVQGILTVTDTPQVHTRVEQYVKTLNSIANRQIAVEAHVFEITSDDTGEFDANIMALYDMKGDFSIGTTGGIWSIVRSSGDPEDMNRFSSSSAAALNLLRTNRNSSLVTSSTIYAMNGQPTPFQQVNEVTYIAERSVTTVEGGTTEASITPGKVVEGISMMIMPRIVSDGRVMMNFSIDTSSILAMNKEGVEGQHITMPEKASNRYQQVVTVRNGEPLMIAGLERTNHDTTIKSPFGRHSWMLGGSKAGGKTRVMTMIVLTPYVMSK